MKNCQAGLRDVFTIVFKNGAPKGSFIDIGINLVKQIISGGDADILMDDLVHSSEYFVKDLVPILTAALDKSGIEIDVKTLVNDLETLLGGLIGVFASNPSLIISLVSSTNVKSLASAHYPDICLANTQARDPNYVDDPITSDMSGRYYLFKSPDYTKSFLIKKGDNVIAKCTDGDIEDVSSSFTYAIHASNFVAYLPIDEGYTVELDKGVTGTLYVYEPSEIRYEEVASVSATSSSGALDSNVNLIVK